VRVCALCASWRHKPPGRRVATVVAGPRPQPGRGDPPSFAFQARVAQPPPPTIIIHGPTTTTGNTLALRTPKGGHIAD